MKRCFLTPLAVLLLGSGSPTEYDDSTKHDGLEGTWSKIEVVYNGQNLGRSGQPFFIVRGNTFTWKGEGPATTGTYTVDPGTKPARTEQLPLSGPGKGSTWRMIYQVDGDKLTIAYTGTLNEYPKGFDDKDTYITTMKRLKK